MNLRASWIWPVCALLGLSVAVPAAQAASTSAAASAPAPRFRFDAGAPLAAPAGVASDGVVCVGTVDGYVHVLGPDGTFHWSRSVHGAVTRRPHFAGERWYIATNEKRLYALNRDGSLAWVFQLYSAIDTELVSDTKGTLYFVTADHLMYGFTPRGQVTLRKPFRPGLKPEVTFSSASELRDPDGNSWLGRSDGVLEFRPATAEKPSLFALTSSALLVPIWSRVSRFAVVSARSGLVFGLDPTRLRAGH